MRGEKSKIEEEQLLRSMTGFGKGEAENSRAKIYIEIKSLNHKYFDMINRLPPGFLIYEDKIKARVQKDISRGRINLSLDYEDLSREGTDALIDTKTARRYAKLLGNLKKSAGLSGSVTLQQIVSMPGIITYIPQKADTKYLWPLIKKALARAIRQLLASKQQEGGMLKAHLFGISKKIETSLNAIKRYSAEFKKTYKNKLASNIKNITGQTKIYNREKLEEEAAIFIRNYDISEEICRIDAHIKALKKAAHNHKGVGKYLDFIAQEISREANTIGAKSGNFKISKETIETKGLVEKIREQTQNVE